MFADLICLIVNEIEMMCIDYNDIVVISNDIIVT